MIVSWILIAPMARVPDIQQGNGDGDGKAAAVLMQAHGLKARQVLLQLVEARYGKSRPAWMLRRQAVGASR